MNKKRGITVFLTFLCWLLVGAAWGESYQPCDSSIKRPIIKFSYLGSGDASNTSNDSQPAPFRVFDATTFRDKPDLSIYGIEPVNIVYEGSVFMPDKPSNSLPSDGSIKRVATAAKASQGISIIDVELWQWLPNITELYVKLTQQLKIANPELKMGYYSIVPKRDYWRAKEGPSSEKYKMWQLENDQLQDIADCVDYLIPSLYTFYDYQPGWVAYAEANIAEARRLARGKPVYVFLWFQYHESNPELKLKPIPADYWKLQLETVRRLADGIVLWGGVNWDPNAPWWIETQKFLASLHETNP